MRSFDLDIRDGGTLEREVFLLGAGFSIAISGQMPTTAKLREACNARLSETALAWLAQRGLGQVQDFEVVLSELAAPQPYLDESTNQHNMAVFTEYSKALHDAISMSSYSTFMGSWDLRWEVIPGGVLGKCG